MKDVVALLIVTIGLSVLPLAARAQNMQGRAPRPTKENPIVIGHAPVTASDHLDAHVFTYAVLDDWLVVLAYRFADGFHVRTLDLSLAAQPLIDERTVPLFRSSQYEGFVVSEAKVAGSIKAGTATVSFGNADATVAQYAYLAPEETNPWIRVGPAHETILREEFMDADQRYGLSERLPMFGPTLVTKPPASPPSTITIVTPGRWILDLRDDGTSRILYDSDPKHALQLKLPAVALQEVLRRVSTTGNAAPQPPAQRMRVTWRQEQCWFKLSVDALGVQQILEELVRTTKSPRAIETLNRRPAFPAVPEESKQR